MSVKMKYNVLSFLFYIAGCCFAGFVAVFLQYKGVSNTLIGVVTGSGCVAAIFLTPFLSSLVMKIKGLNVKKMIYIVYSCLAIVYLAISLFPIPPLFVMVIYMIVYALYLSAGPFMQLLASDYMRIGEDVNFGLARGLGSTAWAVGALGFGFLVDIFTPTILCIGFLFFTLCMLGLLSTMPTVETITSTDKKSGSVFYIVRRYHIFTGILFGFALMLSAATSLSTYLINIVNNLGGDTSFFGIAVFLMAFSEMPVMAITPSLMRRYKSIQLIGFATVCYVLRNFLICVSPNLLVLCVGMMFQGFSFGMLTAVLTYYVIYNLEPIDQVMGQTMIIMMTSGLGAMIGNLLGGVLQDTFGLEAMYIFVYTLTLLGASIVAFAKFKSREPQLKIEIKR